MIGRHFGGAALALLTFSLCNRLLAQCPDGSLPPCQLTARAVKLDPQLVAIFPFRISGSAAETVWLREGTADLLNLALDDLEPLRTVSTRALLARAHSFTDATTEVDAAQVARSLGAGRMILGTAVIAGRELRARAELFDAQSTRRIAAVEARGVLDDPAHVIDSLAVGLARAALVTEGGSHPRPLSDFTTVSPAALRSYLEAERLSRHGQWIPAADTLLHAVAQDSTFGLAYYQLWVVANFGAAGQLTFDPVERGLQFAAHLSARPKLLLQAIHAMNEGDAATARDAGVELGQRYADDPEAAFIQGEILYHIGLALGDSPRAALEAFDRTIQLDASLLDPYNHDVELRVMLGDTAHARLLARHAVVLAPHSFIHRTTELAARLASGEDLGRILISAESVADTLGPDNGPSVFWHTGWEVCRMLTDEPGRALRLADTLFGYGASARWGADMRLPHLLRRFGLRLAQGRFQDARDILGIIDRLAPDGPVPELGPVLDLAASGAHSEDWTRLRARVDSIRDADPIDVALLAMQALTNGDSIQLDGLLRHLRQGAGLVPYREAVVAGLEGLAALQHGDSALARRRLLAAQTAPPYDYQGPSRVYDLSPLFAARLAELELAAGFPEEAKQRLEAGTFVIGIVPWRAELEELRGRVGSALGDTAMTRRGYRNLIELWKDADPELQPRVAAARAALARLAQR